MEKFQKKERALNRMRCHRNLALYQMRAKENFNNADYNMAFLDLMNGVHVEGKNFTEVFETVMVEHLTDSGVIARLSVW